MRKNKNTEHNFRSRSTSKYMQVPKKEGQLFPERMREVSEQVRRLTKPTNKRVTLLSGYPFVDCFKKDT